MFLCRCGKELQSSWSMTRNNMSLKLKWDLLTPPILLSQASTFSKLLLYELTIEDNDFLCI